MSDLDTVRLELALAGRDQAKLAAWAERYGEELIRAIEDGNETECEEAF